MKIKRPFKRIQRITGYLTTPGRENSGKKAEIRDRVKHQKVEPKEEEVKEEETKE